MCGIVGQIGPQAADEETLLRMMGALTHRGPDECGLLLDDGVALGHLRLSIVDLQSGQQPMSSHDGRYWVVFNGEIFNHLELREELQSRGHTFLTHSDTEVLINCFREWGDACLNRLNGQWAFALWDRRNQSFFLARDRWGVRPLFYTSLGDRKTLIFASEIKAILADRRVPREWNYQALRDIFVCWVSAGGKTPIKAIHQLPPGCSMTICDGKAEIRQWWNIDYSPDHIEWDRSLESWCEELRTTLSQACSLRLRADVPVGAYLSGGLDSSIIALLTRELHSNRLSTFSLAFTDSDYDESEYQRIMATHLATRHRELKVDRESIADDFYRVIWHTETPIYRTAPAPMMRLAQLVRDSGFKVVLTGEGADEVFGGYDLFKEAKIRRFWARQPDSKWRKRLLERLEANIPRADSRTRAFWYAFYQKELKDTERAGFSHHVRWKNGMSLLPLLNGDLKQLAVRGAETHAAGELTSDWIAEMEGTAPEGLDEWHSLSKAQYWESRQLLSGYLLSSQGDRMSMAHSVEGRYPFLDVNVFELARRMPPDLKLRALKEKFVLKRTFTKLLPAPVVGRHKHPYRAPDALALYHGPARDRLTESLSLQSTRRRGLFDPEAIGRLLDRVESTPEPSSRDNIGLVLVYSSHLFHDMFIEGSIPVQPLPPMKTKVGARVGTRTS